MCNNANEDKCDLDKSKIEVVRDALKDAIDTIRALDRKASYIIAIILFLISSFVLITLKIKNKLIFENTNISIDNIVNLFLFFPIIYFVIAIALLFYSYNPVSNPMEVLKEDDKSFGKDTFFIFYSKDQEKDAKDLTNNFLLKAKGIDGILRILYIEILKISKIRERKISLIKLSIVFLFIGLISEIIQIFTFYNFSPQLFGVTVITTFVYFICKRLNK